MPDILDLLLQQTKLAGKTRPEMTYYMSSGTLKSTHSSPIQLASQWNQHVIEFCNHSSIITKNA